MARDFLINKPIIQTNEPLGYLYAFGEFNVSGFFGAPTETILCSVVYNSIYLIYGGIDTNNRAFIGYFQYGTTSRKSGRLWTDNATGGRVNSLIYSKGYLIAGGDIKNTNLGKVFKGLLTFGGIMTPISLNVSSLGDSISVFTGANTSVTKLYLDGNDIYAIGTFYLYMAKFTLNAGATGSWQYFGSPPAPPETVVKTSNYFYITTPDGFIRKSVNDSWQAFATQYNAITSIAKGSDAYFGTSDNKIIKINDNGDVTIYDGLSGGSSITNMFITPNNIIVFSYISNTNNTYIGAFNNNFKETLFAVSNSSNTISSMSYYSNFGIIYTLQNNDNYSRVRYLSFPNIKFKSFQKSLSSPFPINLRTKTPYRINFGGEKK